MLSSKRQRDGELPKQSKQEAPEFNRGDLELNHSESSRPALSRAGGRAA
jgi:hypothetical protein